MDTLKNLQALLDSDEYQFRFDIGVNVPSASVALKDKERIALSIAMHYLVYSCKAELDQMKDGLLHLHVLGLVERYPVLMHP